MVSYRDGVSIGVIGFYTPALIIGVILTVVLGFGYNSGWIFLATFALVRIVGSCLQLATIHDPTSVDLHAWAAILQSIGLSLLMLAALGLLSRVITSTSNTHRVFPHRRHLYLIYLVVTAALILGIYGGIKAGDKLRSTGKYLPQIESKISVALFVLAHSLIFVAEDFTALRVLHAEPGSLHAAHFTALRVSHAERGERLLLLAVYLSLPFFGVRLTYSCLSTFRGLGEWRSEDFNVVDGNVTIWLVMGVITEAIVVIIYEITGLTVRKLKKADTMVAPPGQSQVQPSASPAQLEAQSPYE